MGVKGAMRKKRSWGFVSWGWAFLCVPFFASGCLFETKEPDPYSPVITVMSPPSNEIFGDQGYYQYSPYFMGNDFNSIEPVVRKMMADGAKPVEAWFDAGTGCSQDGSETSMKMFVIRFETAPRRNPDGFQAVGNPIPFTACGTQARIFHFQFE